LQAIEARSLTKTYPGDITALDELSFAVEEGSVFGLLGPNGAGKSTTVKVLTTLSRPDSGAASVAGFDIRVSTSPSPSSTAPPGPFLDEPTTASIRRSEARCGARSRGSPARRG